MLRPHPWLAGRRRDARRGRDDLGRDLDRRRARARAPRPARRRGTLLAARSSPTRSGRSSPERVLARRPVRRKARASLFAWLAYLPAYLLLAFAHSLGPALAGALVAGAGQGAALVLTLSAAQTEIPDSHLGRVHRPDLARAPRRARERPAARLAAVRRGAATRSVFLGAAFAIPLVSLTAAGIATRCARP